MSKKKDEYNSGDMYCLSGKYYIAGPNKLMWSWSDAEHKWISKRPYKKHTWVFELDCKKQAEFLKVTTYELGLLSEQVFHPRNHFSEEELESKNTQGERARRQSESARMCRILNLRSTR